MVQDGLQFNWKLGNRKIVTEKLGSILASATDFLYKSGHARGGIHPPNSNHGISMALVKSSGSIRARALRWAGAPRALPGELHSPAGQGAPGNHLCPPGVLGAQFLTPEIHSGLVAGRKLCPN